MNGAYFPVPSPAIIALAKQRLQDSESEFMSLEEFLSTDSLE